MAHNQHNHQSDNLRNKKLLWVTFLNFFITIAQIIGGIISNSLSLLSDALHNLGDSSALFIAFLAGKRSQKKPNNHRTFGYKRIEILAALFNAVVLIAIGLYLFFEAYHRFLNPEPIKGKIMIFAAVLGLLGNLFSVFILNKDKKHNLNLKTAYLHLIGDTLASVAVILGGIAIWLFDVFWIDPVITVVVSVFIMYYAWGIVKQTVDILMQSTPENICITDIKQEVEKNKEIENIHHVHVWKLDDKQIHFEAHINLKSNISMKKMMLVKQQVEHILGQQFKIQHITLQMEYKSEDN